MENSTDDLRKRRTVRSFVRRAGRMTASQTQALALLWPEYGVDFAPKPLNFTALFGRNAPRVLEIGFGNGESLIAQALSMPDADFLGIDVHKPGVGHCLIKARQAGVKNLRLIVHDAIEVLEQQIPEQSLTRINLYFPDPWPKKRHHKRRIVQHSFLELCARCLEISGTLHIATDWSNYAEHVDEILQQSVRFGCVDRRVHDGSQPLDRPGTKFERRGLMRGHKIWDWQFVYKH